MISTKRNGDNMKKTTGMLLDVDADLNKQFKALCKSQRLGFPRDVAIGMLEDAIKKAVKKVASDGQSN